MKKTEWFHVATRGKNHAILIIDAVGLAIKKNYSETQFGIRYFVKHYRQCHNSRSIGLEDYKTFIKLLDEKMKEQPDYYYHFGVQMEKTGDKIIKRVDELKDTNWEELTNDQLASLMEEFAIYEGQLYGGPIIYTYYFHFSDIIVEGFMTALKERLGEKKFDEILPALIATEKIGLIAEGKKELLMLAKKALETGNIDEGALKEHWKKYAFLNVYYYWGEGYTLEDINQNLKELMEKGVPAIEKELKEFESKDLDYNLFSEEEKVLIKSMKKVSYSLQAADEALSYYSYCLRPFLHETAKRLGLTYNEFVSMRLSEIMESLKK